MNRLFKYFLYFSIFIVLGFSVFFAVERYRYYQSPQYEAERYFGDLQKRYEADAYGGNTPEETLQLFVDALKKGDVELASRYMVIEKQDEEKKYLQEMRDKGLFDRIIENVNKLELTKNDEREAFFVITNEKNVVEIQVILQNINNKWKISEL